MADRTMAASLFCSAGLLLLGSQASHANEAETPPPTLDFLEYLGEWQDGDGQPIDPMVFGNVETPDEDAGMDGDRQ